ncbi:MAG: signal peptide peptidase SppA [Alphaproteobacteria bacterium]|nr:signal peptide peptidase SppA [Alphaproteobacteria bacterium]
MSFSADALLDRQYLKRALTRWRVIAVLAAVIALVALAERHDFTGHAPIGIDYIARLTITGVVEDDKERDKLLTDLRDNPNVKAVLLRLDTPGGSAVAGEEIFTRLRLLAQKKPVVAVMRDLSASAGYLAALGADRIFAREGTLTGSIGVIIEGAEFSELEHKLGVTPLVVKTGPLKDAFSPFTKATPEATQAMQSVVNDFFRYFVTTVAARRNLPEAQVLQLADGRVFTGRQALNSKLIDAIGGEDEALAWLESDRKLPHGLHVRDAEVKHDKLPAWLDHVTGTVMQKFFPQSAAGLDGLVAIWHPSL